MKALSFFISIMFIFFSVETHSQNRFTEGYYITKDGEKTESLIEMKKWKTWSNELLMIKENGEKRSIPFSGLQEFGVENHIKFIVRSVEVVFPWDIAFKDSIPGWILPLETSL